MRAPENTLAAVSSALAAGVDLIEVDVRTTADGQAVLLHDRDLAGTTDGRGYVDVTPWSVVRTLDAGSRFGPGFAGEPVPLLADVLDLVDGRVRLNLDLKSAAAIPVVARLLVATGRTADVVVSGCTGSWVRAVRSAHRDLTVLLNLNRGQKAVARAGWRAPLRWWLTVGARRAGVPGINVPHQWVDRALVEAMARQGRTIWAFTVDDPARARQLAGMGVAAVTTNDPAAMVAAFAGNDGGAPGTT
jgi:glycerophosphoryl diester phosphodiesterase